VACHNALFAIFTQDICHPSYFSPLGFLEGSTKAYMLFSKLTNEVFPFQGFSHVSCLRR
jgi:hypothetical protein